MTSLLEATSGRPTSIVGRARAARSGIVWLMAAGLALFGLVAVDGFASVDNVLTLLRLGSALGIVAVGASAVIMMRGIDLSVAAVIAVVAQTTVVLVDERSWPEFGAIAAVLALAVAMGMINGVLVAYLELPALFVTLATWQLFLSSFQLTILQRDTYVLSESATMIRAFARGELLGVPIPIWAAVTVFALAALFWNRTAIGLMMRATGDSPAAGFIAGIPVRPLQVTTFVIAAVLAGVAAFILLGTQGGYSTSYGAGTSILFDAIAVAVIGGWSLSGGKGSVSGLVAATVLIALVSNVMVLLDISLTGRTFAKALVLLAAVVLDAVLNPRDEEAARLEEL